MTIGDLCSRSDNATAGKLTFYLEISKNGSRLAELCDDSWILFCKFMDPREETLSYLGSITLRKCCAVFELETKARGLIQRPGNAKWEIVVQKHDLFPTGVGRLVTLENVRLGSSLVVFVMWQVF